VAGARTFSPSLAVYNNHPLCAQIKPVRPRRPVSKGFQLCVFGHACKRVQAELGFRVHRVQQYNMSELMLVRKNNISALRVCTNTTTYNMILYVRVSCRGRPRQTTTKAVHDTFI
jgi:hypothetical protein